ncbi:MAG TPA: hypothetical protein VK145_01030, partial [Candidatus Nanoarchaeia archaeon]|nr:hypothetical protein [Candidatus Nanoarchaeia archaeon]
MENNKQDIFYTVINKAKEITLTSQERNSLFQSVDAFVARNPIKKSAQVQSVLPAPVKSPFFAQDWFFAFSQRSHNFYIATALVVLVVFGTGTSFASQNTLPGDLLYPIKVNVLEEVKAQFLPSSSRPVYEIKRAQARVGEVKKLAAQNKLSDEVKVAVAARLDDHIATVKKEISTYKEKGDLKHVLEISNSLELALANSQNEISTLEDDQSQASQVAFVRDIIDDSKEEAVKTRETIEEEIFVKQINDESTLEIARAKSEITKKSLDEIKQRLAIADKAATNPQNSDGGQDVSTLSLEMSTFATTVADEPTISAKSAVQAKVAAPEPVVPTIEDLIVQADDLFKQGQEKMDAKEYNEAFRLFREANYITQIIEFRLGASSDIVSELDTVLQDINLSDSEVNNENLKADLGAT